MSEGNCGAIFYSLFSGPSNKYMRNNGWTVLHAESIICYKIAGNGCSGCNHMKQTILVMVCNSNLLCKIESCIKSYRTRFGKMLVHIEACLIMCR